MKTVRKALIAAGAIGGLALAVTLVGTARGQPPPPPPGGDTLTLNVDAASVTIPQPTTFSGVANMASTGAADPSRSVRLINQSDLSVQGTGQTDSLGRFSIVHAWAAPGIYPIYAQILDGTGKVIGTSPAISVIVSPQVQALPTGLLVPLFIYPAALATAWQPLLAVKRANPAVPILAIVNPNNGPGIATDPNYVNGIAALRQAGVLVLAYVHTTYGARTFSDIITDLEGYLTLYKSVFDGLFVDEMGTSNLSYNQQIAQYAKSVGFPLVVGNPGTDVPQNYVGVAADVLVIYEGSGLPTVGYLDGWHSSFTKQTWAMLAHDIASLNQAFVIQARSYVGLMYMTSDSLYQAFPPYLAALATTVGSSVP